MAKKLYWRCNGGDYVLSTVKNCPWDGWTAPEIEELCSVAEAFTKEGKVPSISALQQAGVKDKALQRAVVMEFGDDRAAFDALMPEAYVHAGKVLKMRELPRELK